MRAPIAKLGVDRCPNALYYKAAREAALTNGGEFHHAAILWRRNKHVATGINGEKHSDRFWCYFSDTPVGESCVSISCHAEMAVLRYAKPGDLIEVMRWRNDGTMTISRPCHLCQIRIKRIGLRVRYTDKKGLWKRL